MNLKAFVESSALLRACSILFLFLILMGAAFIAIWEIINNQPLNPYAISMLSAGLSACITISGVHLGAVVQSNTPVPAPPTLEEPTVKMQKVSVHP